MLGGVPGPVCAEKGWRQIEREGWRKGFLSGPLHANRTKIWIVRQRVHQLPSAKAFLNPPIRFDLCQYARKGPDL